MAPLPSRMMLGKYPQIPPPMETQYQMSESSSPYKSGSLKSMLYRQENWEGFDASRVHSAELNLVDEKGKKSISLEDDVEANLDGFMDPCLFIDFGNLEDDVEATGRLFEDNDDNSNLHDKLLHDVKTYSVCNTTFLCFVFSF